MASTVVGYSNIPSYLQGGGTSSGGTKPTVTPENYQSFFKAAYGGVPMGVDLAQLSALYQDTMAAGMKKAWNMAKGAVGSAGGAPGKGGYTAEALRRTAGEQAGILSQILAQALGQTAQNTLAARGQIAGGMLGPTQQYQSKSEPSDKGALLGSQLGQSFGGGAAGGGGAGGGKGAPSYGSATGEKPWWLTSYGEMNQGQGAVWNALQPKPQGAAAEWSAWGAAPTGELQGDIPWSQTASALGEQRWNYQRDPGTGKIIYSPYTGGSQYVTGLQGYGGA